MPIFEYTCADCGSDFEELVFSRDETPPCPDCGCEDVAKRLSVFAFKSTGAERPAASSAHSSCSGCASGSCSGCSHH
jgi:putative FmdB family regulatory protein